MLRAGAEEIGNQSFFTNQIDGVGEKLLEKLKQIVSRFEFGEIGEWHE